MAHPRKRPPVAAREPVLQSELGETAHRLGAPVAATTAPSLDELAARYREATKAPDCPMCSGPTALGPHDPACLFR
jgi:hypothetical protein